MAARRPVTRRDTVRCREYTHYIRPANSMNLSSKTRGILGKTLGETAVTYGRRSRCEACVPCVIQLKSRSSRSSRSPVDWRELTATYNVLQETTGGCMIMTLRRCPMPWGLSAPSVDVHLHDSRELNFNDPRGRKGKRAAHQSVTMAPLSPLAATISMNQQPICRPRYLCKKLKVYQRL